MSAFQLFSLSACQLFLSPPHPTSAPNFSFFIFHFPFFTPPPSVPYALCLHSYALFSPPAHLFCPQRSPPFASMLPIFHSSFSIFHFSLPITHHRFPITSVLLPLSPSFHLLTSRLRLPPSLFPSSLSVCQLVTDSRGCVHLSPGNLEKPRSSVTHSHPFSMARAA
mgnify:CR=1 FL=1